MVIVAFDPGTHTGVAHYDALQSLARGNIITITLEAQSTEHPDNLYHDLWVLLAKLGEYKLNGQSVTLVVESFGTVHPGVAISKDGVLTQKLCGFLEGVGLCMGYQIVWQKPTVRKAFEDRARELILQSHTTPHELSAMSHLLAYLYRTTAQSNAAITP